LYSKVKYCISTGPLVNFAKGYGWLVGVGLLVGKLKLFVKEVDH